MPSAAEIAFMKSDLQKVETERFRTFVPEESQSVERQRVLRTASVNDVSIKTD